VCKRCGSAFCREHAPPAKHNCPGYLPASRKKIVVGACLIGIVLACLIALVFVFGPPGGHRRVGPFRIEWSVDLSKYGLTQVHKSNPTVYDVDGDGEKEILFGYRRRGKNMSSQPWESRLVCFSHRGKVEWMYPPRGKPPLVGGILTVPTIADLDGDGDVEILFGSRDGCVYCLDGSGSKKWSFFSGAVIDASPQVYDVDGDGHLEVFFGTTVHWGSDLDPAKSGRIFCLDDTGEESWMVQLQDRGELEGALVVWDIDQDESPEVVATCRDCCIYCFSAVDGLEEWRYCSNAPFFASTPVVADVDMDGRYEVVAMDDAGSFLCLSSKGRLLWRSYPSASHGFGSAFRCEFPVADIDGDGHLETVVMDDSCVYCVDLTAEGQVEWTFDGCNASPWSNYDLFADVTGDGEIDVLLVAPCLYVLTNKGMVQGVFDTGKIRPMFAGRAESGMWAGDVDDDGVVEILVKFEGDEFYCLSMDGEYDASNMPWPKTHLCLENRPVLPIQGAGAGPEGEIYTGCTGSGIGSVVLQPSEITMEIGEEKELTVRISSQGYRGNISLMGCARDGEGATMLSPHIPWSCYECLGFLEAGKRLEAKIPIKFLLDSSGGKEPFSLTEPTNIRIKLSVQPSACWERPAREANNAIRSSNWISVTVLPLKTSLRVAWEKTYGSSLVEGSIAGIARALDGGFFLAGNSAPFTEPAYLLKIDAEGNRVWEKTYEGVTLRSIAGCSEGGILLMGVRRIPGEGTALVLTRVDAEGQKIWEKTYSGESVDRRVVSVVESGDGGFVVVGWTSAALTRKRDIYLLKVDSDGNVGWEKTYVTNNSSSAYWVVRAKDGGFMVAGNTGSTGSYLEEDDIFLLRIGADGEKLWEKTYGGNRTDWATCIVGCGDGGFIVGGYRSGDLPGAGGRYLFKVDSQGNKLWERGYGGEQIVAAKDGGFVVCGAAGVFKINGQGEKVWEKTCWGGHIVGSGDGGFVVAGDIGGDVFYFKIDGEGNKLWERMLGDTDSAQSIVQSGDGGFVVAGYTNSFGAGMNDVYLLKVDENGEKIWEKTYGGKDWEAACSIVQSGDGGFVVAGTAGLGNLYLLRIDSEGEKVWEKRYVDDYGWTPCIVQCGDGGFLVVGEKAYDVYLLKIDGNGNRIWERTYGGDNYDLASCAVLSPDGGFVVAGFTAPLGTRSGDEDVYLLKVDSQGNKVWERTYEGSEQDFAESIARSQDGGFVIAGFTNSFGIGRGREDVYLLKVDSQGNKVWERTYGGSEQDFAESIVGTKDGGFVVAGWTSSFQGYCDVYILRTDSQGMRTGEMAHGARGIEEKANCIIRSGDGAYVVAGVKGSNPDVYLLKIEESHG